jgi:hypothetical protein
VNVSRRIALSGVGVILLVVVSMTIWLVGSSSLRAAGPLIRGHVIGRGDPVPGGFVSLGTGRRLGMVATTTWGYGGVELVRQVTRRRFASAVVPVGPGVARCTAPPPQPKEMAHFDSVLGSQMRAADPATPIAVADTNADRVPDLIEYSSGDCPNGDALLVRHAMRNGTFGLPTPLDVRTSTGLPVRTMDEIPAPGGPVAVAISTSEYATLTGAAGNVIGLAATANAGNTTGIAGYHARLLGTKRRLVIGRFAGVDRLDLDPVAATKDFVDSDVAGSMRWPSSATR